jgi:transcriptional regulator with XRE-family HTH domain
VEEIGRRLRAARESKKITLELAEEETKIRKKYLEALEGGREADLPGEAYLKGFLRTYGNYLGLDGAALVEEYKRRKYWGIRTSSEAPQQTGTAASHPRAVPRPAPAPGGEPSDEHSQEGPGERRRTSAEPSRSKARASRQPAVRANGRKAMGRARLVGLILVLLALAAVGLWVWRGDRLGETLGIKPAAESPGQNSTGGTSSGPSSQQGSQGASQSASQGGGPGTGSAAAAEPVKVTMTQNGRSEVTFKVSAKEVVVRVEPENAGVWLRATVDGAVRAEATYRAPVEFKGRQVSLLAGHMNSVSLVVNGQRFDKPLSGGPYTLNFIGE